MNYTQETRLIKIKTPLGKDTLLLQGFNGEEAISHLFNFKLDLLSLNPKIDYSAILSQNVTITVELNDGSQRFFNGFISRFTQGGSNQELTHYTAEMVPWTWFLTLNANCRIFQKMTAPDIIEKVFSDMGFSDFRNELHGSFRKRDYCVQYRESDFNFISRLMEEEGIYYFFEHSADKHIMVLANSPNIHQPCNGQPRARYQTSGDGALKEDVVQGWEILQSMRSGKIALRDYNFEMPTNKLQANITGTGSNNSQYEVYDYPGNYQQKADGDNLIKVRIEETEAPGITINGSSNCRAFSAGYRFDLFDHYRNDMNATYLLTAIRHVALENSYAPSANPFGDGFSYRNEFTCIPFTVPYRPASLTSKPFVRGVQTAVVVGPSDEEIWVDQYGRVKVQFHWDREGKSDENSSCWVRVSQNWAGKKWGVIFIPRIGQEVIVDFLEGDPDRPIITGRVYNAQQMPPYELPAEQTKSAIKSDSSKGHGGFNELRFEDKKGSEQIFIHAQHDFDQRVLNDAREWVGNERHLVVEANQKEAVKGDKHLKVEGNRNEEVGQTISIKAGQKIVIEAGMEISLKASGNFISIGPAGVYINGQMVYLNSGGAAGAPTAPEAPDIADDGTKSGKM